MSRPDTLGNWALHGNDTSAPGEKQIDRFVTRMLIFHDLVDEFTTADTKLCFAGRPNPYGNGPADSVENANPQIIISYVFQVSFICPNSLGILFFRETYFKRPVESGSKYPNSPWLPA